MASEFEKDADHIEMFAACVIASEEDFMRLARAKNLTRTQQAAARATAKAFKTAALELCGAAFALRDFTKTLHPRAKKRWKFRGITAFAAREKVTRTHAWLVLSGVRHSPRLTAAWKNFNHSNRRPRNER